LRCRTIVRMWQIDAGFFANCHFVESDFGHTYSTSETSERSLEFVNDASRKTGDTNPLGAVRFGGLPQSSRTF
jgi:hypothetical protein